MCNLEIGHIKVILPLKGPSIDCPDSGTRDLDMTRHSALFCYKRGSSEALAEETSSWKSH